MKDFLEAIALALAGFAGLFVVAILFAWPVQLLWNALLPELFGLPTISLLQALGLSTLSSLLLVLAAK